MVFSSFSFFLSFLKKGEKAILLMTVLFACRQSVFKYLLYHFKIIFWINKKMEINWIVKKAFFTVLIGDHYLQLWNEMQI